MTGKEIILVLISWWPWGFIKIFLIVLLLLYTVFAAICLRQIDLMNQVIEAQISPLLRLIAILHLSVAILILLYSLIIL